MRDSFEVDDEMGDGKQHVYTLYAHSVILRLVHITIADRDNKIVKTYTIFKINPAA